MNIKFKSDDFTLQIADLLDVSRNEFTNEELAEIRHIKICKENFEDSKTDCVIEDLLLLENLEECSLYKFDMESRDFETLEKISKLAFVYFDFCKLNSPIKLSKVESIVINGCEKLKFENTDAKNIKILTNGNIDILDFCIMPRLCNIEIHSNEIDGIEKILEIAPNLKKFNIDGCKEYNKEFIENLKKMIRVSNNEKFYLANA